MNVFYPSEETAKLKYYSKLFGTVEIDSTFYAYPSRGTVAGWVRNTPKDFTFSAKLPKVISHDKVLDLEKDVETDLRRFIDLMEPVRRADKLGVILIQLPPFFTRDFGRLEEFFKALPQEYKWAVEFRNLSWLADETWELLKKYHVANTIVDEPLLPPDPIVTSPHVFIRWHGRGKKPWYNYNYSELELEPWVKSLRKLQRESHEIYGYFNNHFRAYAVKNCIQMMKSLGVASETQIKSMTDITRHLAGEASQTTLGKFI